jgi:hypothetical protein
MDGNFVIFALALIACAVIFGLQIIHRMEKETRPDEKAKQRDNLKGARDRAAQGDRAAQFALGLGYSEGAGLKRNFREAYFWLALSARGAPPDAFRDKTVKQAGQMLVEAEQNEIHQRLDAWQPGPHAADTVEIPEE